MLDLEDMTPGQVLADASVAEFIKTLGLSIAEAQKALDENSVDQIGEFITPREGLGGRTLLDMGLSPAFYHYQHADISCSLQLNLRVEKDLSVGLNLSGSFSDTTTSDENRTASSSSTESGSETRTSERTASVNIEAQSQGALTIGGRNFQLSGDDPFTRIRNLQEAVTADDAAGVPRLLYRPTPRTFQITTDAPADKVQTTTNTISFQGGGFDRAVIQVDTDVATDYRLNASTTVSTTAQGSVSTYADHVAAQINAAGMTAFVVGPSTPLMKTYFRTGRHHLETFSTGSTTYNDSFAQRLMELAQFIRLHSIPVEIEGYADAQPYRGQGSSSSDQSNRDLGDRRAHEIERFLLANGVQSSLITMVPSRGAADAQAAGGPEDNVNFRRAEVRTRGRTAYYIFVRAPNSSFTIENVSPDKLTPPLTPGNGFIFLYRPQPLALAGKKVTIDGTEFGLSGAAGGGHGPGTPSAHAHNLSTAINGNAAVDFTSSAEANVVTVFGKTTPFELTLVTSETRQIQISGTEGITITRQFTRSQSSSLTRQNTGNRTVAVGASLDVRFSRQYEMNVTGNSSISARLVSIPAPPQFLETIREFLSGNQN
ncbi:MAG TPA: OmpA family protein [Thermohalobaculum sp.]|nr:OmpA family protein [Thermohalobaculum sp.]